MSIIIRPRRDWGAEAPKKTLAQISSRRPYLFLHHSGGKLSGTPAQQVKKVQDIGFSRGFSDISYTWLLTPDGQFWEGRSPYVSGAHTIGYNVTGHALALVGNFSVSPLTDLLVERIQEFRAWAIEQGLLIRPERPWVPSQRSPQQGHYTPHRAVKATGCPGDNTMAKLDAINSREGTTVDDEDVEEIQRMLASAGFDPGPIDGDVGPLTKAALAEALSVLEVHRTATAVHVTEKAELRDELAELGRRLTAGSAVVAAQASELEAARAELAASVADLAEANAQLADCREGPGEVTEAIRTIARLVSDSPR